MPLGYNHQAQAENLGDTVNLVAKLYDDTEHPVPADELLSVTFTVQDPAEEQTQHTGLINPDGSGTYLYGPTTLEGAHKGMATFTLIDSQIKSVPVDFEVVDPFKPVEPEVLDIIGEAVWHRLEDCFDSELEGPWLRDVTKNYFAEEKMALWVDDAIFEINQQNPPTSFSVGEFVISSTPPGFTTDGPLLIQGTYLTVLRHLIRSYTEQPLPMGAQIVYQDRRDYMERWATVYKMEREVYLRWLVLWKRQFLGLGSIKSLISSKSGRYLGAPMRSPYSVTRGFF